jgi:ribosomal protein S18 acetylase RimI-like enzyme
MVLGSRWVASAWDGEKLIGFARAISDVCSNAYISTVAVLPEYQRRGIGRKLMEMLMEGHEGVKFVLHTSEAGERLYRSLGFVDASRMMVRLRAGEER